jgi:hypothetical protein
MEMRIRAKKRRQVEIVEAYNGYAPPFPLVPVVEKALRVVPRKCLAGLDRIVLLNADGMSRSRRRSRTKSRGKDVRINEALGLYHQPWEGNPAHVELFVDNIVARRGTSVSARFATSMAIASVLFHEVGHHIHLTKHRENGQIETVADRYCFKFMRKYFVRMAPWLLVALVATALNPRKWPRAAKMIRRLFAAIREHKGASRKARRCQSRHKPTSSATP